jgi:hypothetical protein
MSRLWKRRIRLNTSGYNALHVNEVDWKLIIRWLNYTCIITLGVRNIYLDKILDVRPRFLTEVFFNSTFYMATDKLNSCTRGELNLREHVLWMLSSVSQVCLGSKWKGNRSSAVWAHHSEAPRVAYHTRQLNHRPQLWPASNYSKNYYCYYTSTQTKNLAAYQLHFVLRNN